MILLDRRLLLRCAVSAACAAGLGALGARDCRGEDAAALTVWLRHPLLVRTLYRHEVSRDYDADGAAGANRAGYRWIEEQRQGGEWIVRGYAEERPEWIARGWRELDWGLAHQQSDGGFGSQDPFHSTSLFVEALARSCLIDPAGATPARVGGLQRAVAWLGSAAVEVQGARANLPYTHRRYILAAAFGQSAGVLGASRWMRTAAQWADRGLALQLADGTNPEKGGFDASYQMVGVLMALRYWPVCGDKAQKTQLRSMIRRAVNGELGRQRDDGSIDATGSTRVEMEHARSGKMKEINYAEILQALVFAAQALAEPKWQRAAEKIAELRQW